MIQMPVGEDNAHNGQVFPPAALQRAIKQAGTSDKTSVDQKKALVSFENVEGYQRRTD